METPDGVRDLQRIALPLLLNLEPEDFDRDSLFASTAENSGTPRAIAPEMESGSPRPEIELTLDPLGLITPSLKPFASNAAMEMDQPLTSPDHHAHLPDCDEPAKYWRLRLPETDEAGECVPRFGPRRVGWRNSKCSSQGVPLMSRKFR